MRKVECAHLRETDKDQGKNSTAHNVDFLYLYIKLYSMFSIEKTDVFLKWLRGLNDIRAVARIQIRIDRLSLGNMGDVKAVGEGISEMRIDYGPGYRVYFKKTGKTILLLLCGGDKTSQSADIASAKRMAKDI